jgi:uncharacterized protein YkwD
MGVRRLAAAVAVQVVLFVFCSAARASTACPADSGQPQLDDTATAVFSLVCDVNALRARNGIAPVRWNWRLWAGAQRMANDIAARRFFAHVTPDGRNLADRLQPTGYISHAPTWLLAENLAFGTGPFATPLGDRARLDGEPGTLCQGP